MLDSQASGATNLAEPTFTSSPSNNHQDSSTTSTNGVPSEMVDMSSSEAALIVASSVLQQALDFVSNTMTGDDQMSYSSTLLPGSTIGKHLRHARDHFNLLAECLSKPPPYNLSYDVRVRNTPIETSRHAAMEGIQQSIDDLTRIFAESHTASSSYPPITSDTPVALSAVTPFPQTFQTTVGREFWFVALHAIHHFAVVRVLAGELGLKVEDNFGVAPSTIQYRNQGGPSSSQGKAKI